MNLDRMLELEPYLERLKELPFVRQARVVRGEPRQEREQPDATLEIQTEEGRTRFWVEHKRSHLSNEIAERLLHVRAEQPNLLLMCPFVGRELAARFGQASLNFVDLAGNCHVQIGTRFLAHIEGRRTEAKPPTDRALRAQSYRVLFAMLVKPELTTATARALAEASGGVSPQTAIDTRRRFVERGLLLDTARGAKWAPRAWKSALDVFVTGFTSTLAPQLTIGRFRARQRDVEALDEAMQSDLAATADVEWRWGGGAASARMTGYFRGDQTVLYLKAPSASLAKRLHLIPAKDGPVRLATIPSPLAFEYAVEQCVHPLLVYVDLLAEGDERAKDAAAEIYRRHLAPLERGERA